MNNTQKFYIVLKECVYVFCLDLRKNCDYFPLQRYVREVAFITETKSVYCVVRSEPFKYN